MIIMIFIDQNHKIFCMIFFFFTSFLFCKNGAVLLSVVSMKGKFMIFTFLKCVF